MSALLALLVATPVCVPVLETPNGPDDWEWDPPENSWFLDAPPEGLVSEGFHPGDVIPDFRLVDQFGDEVSLWQFHTRLIVVDISTMWCGPCRELARGAEETYQAYADQGLIYMTVLPEDLDGESPDVEDLNLWVDEYDLTIPVVSDPEGGWSGPLVPNENYPVVLVVDRDLQVYDNVNPPTDANIRAAVEELLD
jgi:thiol-disulfide isomerase/thioredoxin